MCSKQHGDKYLMKLNFMGAYASDLDGKFSPQKFRKLGETSHRENFPRRTSGSVPLPGNKTTIDVLCNKRIRFYIKTLSKDVLQTQVVQR